MSTQEDSEGRKPSDKKKRFSFHIIFLLHSTHKINEVEQSQE